jgi:hypothetical protein
MDSPRPQRVSLSGDVRGAFVVVEKRSDGSLVIAPDPSRRSVASSPPQARSAGTLLSSLINRSADVRSSDVEVLEGWGVELREDEIVSEFFVADIDGKTGFLVITSRRFIFVADTGKGLEVIQEHLLSAARNIEVVRRGLTQKLRVTWHGAESLIGLDRRALERVQQYVEGI